MSLDHLRLSRSSIPHICSEMLCTGRIHPDFFWISQCIHKSGQGNMSIMSYRRGSCWNWGLKQPDATHSLYSFVLHGSVSRNLDQFRRLWVWYKVHSLYLRYLIWLTAVLHAMFQVQRHSHSPSRQEMSMPALTGYSELRMLVCR